MIAKILSKSATFNGIIYNEEKIKEGVAELLEMNSMGAVEKMGANRTAEATRNYLVEYSRRNDRIKYPQFHVTLSCKGQEYDKQQLLDIAHQYLIQMGYDYKNVPTVIYYHHDTDNNHLHVITSRIDKNGNKVNHNHEKRRSNKIINDIVKKDFTEEVKEHVSKALKYKFENIGQFKAILESWGYETYEEDKFLRIKKGGGVIHSLDVTSIKDKARNIEENKKRTNQVKALLHKFHDLSCNKEDLIKYMKDLFGISLVFLGKKDNPYGYFVIDHRNGLVYKGSEFMKIKQLLSFQSFEDRKKQVDNSISNALEANPRATTKSINSILRRYGAYIAKGQVKIVNRKISLPDDIYENLKRNDKLSFIQKFNPISDMERNALAHVFKIQAEDLAISESKVNTVALNETVDTVRHIFDMAKGNDNDGHYFESLYHDLNDNNIILLKSGDSVDLVAVDMQRKTVISLSDWGIQLKNADSIRQQHGNSITKNGNQQSGVGQGIARIPSINLSGGSASNSINENPEDSKKTNWEQLEGQNGMKR